MVKPASVLFASLLLASIQSFAQAAHDYALTPNDQFDQQCNTDEGPQSSKLKIQLANKGASEASIVMTVKLCTRKFGFRRITVDEKIPSILTNEDAMRALNVGESRKLSAGGQNMTLTRKDDTSSFLVFQLVGLNSKVSTIQISIPKQKGWQSSIPGSNRLALPWYRIQFQYRHALAGTFQLSGKLNEIQRD